MNSIGSIIAASGQMTLLYAERLLAGVRADQFARLARPGGSPLQANHPAWVIGHLSLYPVRVVTGLGQPAGETAFPANYESLFKNGVECRDDADGRLYPPMAPMCDFFFAAYRRAVAAVAAADDAAFARPNPAEGRLRELFPTLGAAINFYLAGHTQSHLGQLSTWRRAMGMGPA
ncbi:MAG: DinB family protein [Phycisphaerae bacterium]